MPSVNKRFWAKVEKTDTCWLWRGYVAKHGYGTYTIGPKTWRVHRYAYEQAVGPIPDGMQIDHLCRVRSCVNPDHLEVVTSRENTLRSPIAAAAVAARKTHCPAGHPYAGENLYAHPAGYRICRACKRDAQRASLPERSEDG